MLQVQILNLIFYLFFSINPINEEIKFFDGSFEQAKKTATLDQKNIVLFFIDDQDKKINIILSNSQFITLTDDYINVKVKVKANENESIILIKTYNIENYPTFLLCGSNGNEIDRIEKPKDSRELIETLKDYSKDLKTLNYFLRLAGTGSKDPEVHHSIAKKYLQRGEKELATTFFSNTLKYDEKQKIDIGDFAYYLVTIRDLREKKWETSRDFIKRYPKSKSLGFVYLGLSDYFLRYEDYERARNVYEEYLVKFPNDQVALNNFAFLSAMLNINLDKALKSIEKAIDLVNDDVTKAMYFDTKAEIFFKMKKYSEAIDIEKKALEIVGNKDSKVKHDIEAQLRKFEGYIK